jgi:glycosyltransferase involved in cell wall biosynthesis
MCLCGKLNSVPQSVMKILYLTSHAPQGQEQGARLRARHILRVLSQFAEVRLVLAGAYEKSTETLEAHSNPSFPSEVYDFQPWSIGGVFDRIHRELGCRYLNTHGVKATDQDRRRLLILIREYDLVWVHGLRIANSFNLWRWPKTILDIDDIPSAVSKTGIVHGKDVEAKLRAFRRFRMWKRHEAHIFERFDAMAVCSEPDRAFFGNSERVFVIPNGFDAPSKILVRRPSSPVRIGFIGSLEYPPNAKGLRWFLQEVWPSILKSTPDATLRLVGRSSDDIEWAANRNVEGLGWVADADTEMSTWTMTIVPIFEGGGTRIKISNAFGRKCPVVSTSLGAYGYDVTNQHELLFADSALDFARACLRLIEDPELSEQLANTAWEKFLKQWTWDANGPRLERAIRFVTERNRVTNHSEYGLFDHHLHA